MSTGEAFLPEAEGEGDTAPRPAVPGLLRTPRLRPWLVSAAWLLGTIIAFAAYLQIARTRAVNSDGASNALQAWDMLHGNPLLRGWSLSDVSFYTTELPQYMLVELVRGLNQDVVHIAAAMTYTLAMLLAALLAKGNSRGREALVRVAVAAGIMLGPQLDFGVNVLLSSPDHIGTSVPIMVAWLILDRARPRWYTPVIAAVLLGWAEVADTLVFYVGVLPLALVCAIRVYRAVAIDQQPLKSQWYDLALGGGALLAAAMATLTLHLIRAAGGFSVLAPGTQFAHGGGILPAHLGTAVEGLLLLGGANFLGRSLTAVTAFALLHVVGVFLAAWGVWLAARRFGRDRDLVAQVLVVAVLVNLVAYVLGTRAHSVPATREIVAVLPFSAALAGRLLAGRLLSAKLVPVLLIVLLGYLIGLAREVIQPSVPAQNAQLTSWLVARHLHTGLSGYWEANIVTLTSGNRVQIRAVSPTGGPLAGGQASGGQASGGQLTGGLFTRGTIESNAAWYDPGRATASFVVVYRGKRDYPGFTDTAAVLATFGQPARSYSVGPYTVLVWNHNLLSDLRSGAG